MRNRFLLLGFAVISLLALVPAGLAGCSTKATPTTEATVQNLSVPDAYAFIKSNANNKNFTIIDVRTSDEYNGGHIPDSININLESANFKSDILTLNKNYTFLVYCQTGVRSANASAQMVSFGFQHVYNMNGGIIAWKAAGYPTTQ